MMIEQQGDVLLFQTVNDGEISVVDGVVKMTPGLDNAVYLSLFGGNADDNGSDGNPLQWWGNHLAADESEKYRSETQFILYNLPAVSANIRPLHDAIQRDLAWMIPAGLATGIDAIVRLVGPNTVSIEIFITGENNVNFTYKQNWLASI